MRLNYVYKLSIFLILTVSLPPTLCEAGVESSGRIGGGVDDKNELESTQASPTGSFTKEKSMNCVVTYNGHVYDLSELSKRNFWFYSEHFDENTDNVYLLSVCQPIENVSTCTNNSGVCSAFVSSGKDNMHSHWLNNDTVIGNVSFTTLGRIPSKDPEILHEGTFKYVYDIGEECLNGNRKMRYYVELQLQCPILTEESPGPILMSSQRCIYIFVWLTHAACPKRIESTSDPCIKKFSNSEYPLNLHSLHSNTFYKASSRNASFEINICGPIQNGSCPTNTAICDTSNPEVPKVLATSEETNFDWRGNSLILSYKSKVSTVSTNIYLYCDRRAFTPRVFFTSNTLDTYNFSIYTINVCNPEPSDCVVQDRNLNVYDLRTLHKKEGNWEVKGTSNGQHVLYLLNVCGPVNEHPTAKCPPGPVGACQPSISTSGSRNIGYITSNPTVKADRSITLLYTGGHSCREGVLSSSTRITFICSKMEYPPVFLQVTDSCEHIFEWHTPAACPRNLVTSEDCRVSDPLFGHNFDLTPLRNVSSDYVVSSGDHSLRINVCGPLVRACNGMKDVAVCKGNGTHEESGGKNPAELVFNDGTLVMKFSNGDPGCGEKGWMSQVLFLCTHDETGGVDGLRYLHTDDRACVHHFLWRTARACPPHSDVACTVTSGNATYDLTPLSNPAFNEIYDTRGLLRRYVLNVCRSVVHSKKSRCAYDAGACLIDLTHKNKSVTLGRVRAGPFVAGGVLKLRYDSGDPCNGTNTHVTVIEFECDHTNDPSYPVLYADESCITVFKWSTVYACPLKVSDMDKMDNCTAVNPLTNYIFDMNSLRREKPYELPVGRGSTLLVSACGSVKDQRCRKEDVGACLLHQDGPSGAVDVSNAGVSNRGLRFYMWSTYLEYTGGDPCPNGILRSTRISFICREDVSEGSSEPVLISDDAEACIFYVHWYTEAACERHIRCFAHSADRTFDLSPLIRTRDNYRVRDPSDPTNTYLINVCRPLNPVIGVNCHPGSSSCLVRKNQEPLGLGHPILNPTVGLDNKIHLMYSHGSNCPGDPDFFLSSQIIFVCNRSAGAGEPRFLQKANECQTQFEWETSVVCPPEDVEEEAQCQIGFEAAKTNVDLSSLRRQEPYQVTHNGETFFVNVCGGAACHDNASAVCTKSGKSYGRSKQSQLQWKYDNLLLTFYGGPLCNRAISGARSAKIYFVCDLEAGLGQPAVDPAMDDVNCTAIFTWRTNLTCLEALYPIPAPPKTYPTEPAVIPKPSNERTAAASGSMDGEDPSSQHTWVSALIAGLVLAGVVLASLFVVGRSAYGRRMYARAKRTLAQKGYASAAESDTLLQGETAFVYRVDEDDQVLRV